MRALALLTIAIVSLLLVAGIGVLVADHPAQASLLTRFASDDELRQFLNGHAARPGLSRDAADYTTAESPAHSGTNVQVTGVDEGDTVKTDGETIFIAEGDTVHLIGTSPGLSNITEITVGNGTDGSYSVINALYLYEKRLIVIGTAYESVPNDSMKGSGDVMYYPVWSTQRTCIMVYDVTDHREPTFVTSGGVSGYLLTSRMIGPVLYVVADQSVWTGDGISMPAISMGGEQKEISATSISYNPACPEVSSFVNLLAFDVTSGEGRSLCTLAGSASVVYLSETALYIAMQHWEPDYALFSYGSSVTTQIYRIAVEGTNLVLTAQGEVEGSLLSQFALDENRDRLRVATTSFGSAPSSTVYMLDMDLKVVGSLASVAPGETIYSSRFMDDRLYLVTFRQVDPLFVIDLGSDHPTVLGQLKIPSASTYLQMVDEGLLGIGFENGSVKVTLFNVTDSRNPVEAGTYTMSGVYSYSAAQYDHHAVLYDAGSDLLIIPVTYYGSKASDYWSYFAPSSAAVVLKLSGTGIAEAGRITHVNATMERSLYIGDVLYTISDTTVKANSLLDLSPLGEMVYAEGRPFNGWYGVAEPMVL